MSGGVDSSVAAYLLKKQGYKVVGVLFKNLPGRVSKCCNADAVSIVGRLVGISTYVIDVQEEFQREIIQNFIDQYKNGFTPNPCVLCNEKIKFGFGFEKARAIFGDAFFATGHYSIIEHSSVRHHLKRGRDLEKDQSYMLWRLKQTQLAKTILPLGNAVKEEVYKIAQSTGLPIPHSESQDVCFISGKIKDFLKQHISEHKGEVIDTNGKVLGEHNGAYFYTVGQRSGLGISADKPMYVVHIDTYNNTVMLGEREECFFSFVELIDLNFIEEWDFNEKRLMGMIRYRTRESPCILKKIKEKIIVQFDEPQFAIAPGQSLVLYNGNYVFGGGIIKKAY